MEATEASPGNFACKGQGMKRRYFFEKRGRLGLVDHIFGDRGALEEEWLPLEKINTC